MPRESSRYLGFVEGDTFLHKADPISKVIWLVMIALWAFLVNVEWRSLVGVCIAIVVIGRFLGKVSVRYQLKTSAPIWAMLFPLIIFDSLLVGDQVLFKLGFLSFKLEGVELGLTVGFRLIALSLSAVNIVRCLNPKLLVYGLVKYVRLSYRIAYIVLVSLNFLPMIQAEVRQIQEAQMVRGIPIQKSFFRKLADIPGLLVPILTAGIRRAYDASIALDSRGFGAYPDRTWMSEAHFTVQGYVLIGVTAVFIISYVFARGLGGLNLH